jgi:UDPglucose 6-dehydrogenase
MILILTEWNDFRALDMPRLKQTMRGGLFADLRNIYSSAEVEGAGFEYTSIGR